MATCQIFRNKTTGEVSKVTAPNGQESELFASFAKQFATKEEALEHWAVAYTDQFKTWFGEWEADAAKQKPESVADNSRYYQVKNIFNTSEQISEQLKNEGRYTAAAIGSDTKIDAVLKKAGLDTELRAQFIQLLKENPELKKLKLRDVLGSYLKNVVKDSDRAYYEAIGESLDKELEQTLIDYFERFHIRREELDSLKDKFGVDAVGVFDVLAKTVYYAKDRNMLTLPEEYGHVFVELLGSIGNRKADNPLFAYMFKNIENWDGYQRVFEDYKDKYLTAEGNIDLYKIRKEAIGQAIGIALVRNYKVQQGDTGFWAKVQEVIDYISNLLKGIDYVSLNTTVDNIAKDILNKNYSRLDRLQKDTSNYNLMSYSETIKAQNAKDGGKALEFMQWFSDKGMIITGSLAYRLQGTTYRPAIDALHDIDNIVPSDIHGLKLDKTEYLNEEDLEKDRMYRKLVTEGNYREAKKYKVQGNLRLDVDQIYDSVPILKEFKDKYPDTDFLYSFFNQKANAYYVTVNAIYSTDPSLRERFKGYSGSFNDRLTNFTEEELEKIYLFDFFLRPETSDEYVTIKEKEYDLNLAHFNYAFYEKLNMMGRAKDAYDYQNWQYFDDSNIMAPDFNDRMVYFQLNKAQQKAEPVIEQPATDTNGEPSEKSVRQFMALPAAEPFTLKGNEALYKYFNLLNEDGQIKTLPYKTDAERKKINDWVNTLSNNKEYRFEVRLTPVGHKIFIFPRFRRGVQDENIQEKYFRDGDTTVAVDVLYKIAQGNHALNRLAQHLISYAESNNVEITLVNSDDRRLPKVAGRTAAGVYDADTNKIYINRNATFRGVGSEPTIIHEILHALSVQRLMDYSDKSVQDFGALFTYAKEKLGGFNDETGEGIYALRDPDEFLVALFTDAPFIRKLSELAPTEGVGKYNNLFEEIMSYLLALLGIRENNTLYGQAYSVATNILEDAKTERKNMEDSYKEFLRDQENFPPSDSLPSMPSVQAEQLDDNALQQQVLNFLTKIGINVETVNSIKDAQGNFISAKAKADMLNRVVQVLEGTMDAELLGEEAAHFFVNMLGDNHPLVKQMMSQITSYEIYRQVVADYKDLPEFRNPDGTINFTKLKKEAIGQLISKYIIKNETEGETQQRVAQAAGWWEKVWKFITDVFSKREGNPFATVASQILASDTSNLGEINADEGVYFNYTASINQLREEQNKLILDNSIDPVSKQKRHIYKRDGRPVRTSVTTLKVDAYYKRIFPNDRRDERQKELDLLKAEYGDVIHEIMEAIYDSYIDPATGLIRDAQLPINHPAADNNMVKMLDGFYLQLIQSYPPGTVFMKEVKVYDPKLDMAGSIDLLAILPDGTVDIYDWKSQEIAKFQTEIKDFKPEAYRIQLGEYKRILKDYYGFTKFGNIRAYPIKTIYNYVKDPKTGETIDLELRDLEIGDFDPVNIPDDKAYLLPIAMDETTGDKQLDKLIKQLNGIYKRIEQKKYRASEKFKQKEELKRYRQAIRDLELKGSIDKFIELGMTEIARIEELLASNDISAAEVLNAMDTLKVFSSTSGLINSILNDFKREVQKQNNPELELQLQSLVNQYNSMATTAGGLLTRVEAEVNEIAKGIALRMGITNFEKEEKEVGSLAGLFNSLSQLDTKALKTFYGMVRGVQNVRDAKFSNMMQELHVMKRDLEAWGKSNGISGDKLFDKMLDFKKGKWTGNFLKKYNSEFYKKRDQAIRDGDWAWIAANTEFDGDRYKIERENKLKYYKEAKFMTDEKANSEAVSKAFYKWVDTHNILNEEGNPNPDAYLNPKNNLLKPAAKWQSDAWKELNTKGNEPLLKVYNYFQKMIREAENLGMLDDFSPEFVPSMFKSKLDHLVFGGMSKDMFAGGSFFEEMMVESGSQYFPDLDPVTGEVLNRVPVYFTRDMGKEGENGETTYDTKSKDLFKVFSIWGAHMYSYEAMSSLEDDANVLGMAERNKESIVTNIFGEAKRRPNGQMDTKPGNERNARLLDDFVKFYLYNRRGGEQYDFKINLFGKTFSVVKSLQFLVGFFSLKTLALNPLSGTAQFVGGTANAFLLGSKKLVMSNDDWVKSMYLLTKRDSKSVAMLDFFDLLLEDHKRQGARELSVSKVVANFTWDKAYVIQRWADSGVQKPLGLAMMQNYMLDPNTGKIVNITTFVKDEMNYGTKFYNLSETDREVFKKDMEEKIGKLKQEKSLFATASIVNDKLVIPGMDTNSKDEATKNAALKNVEEFRAAVKKANKIIIGNSTQDDINSIRTTAYGMILMQFRSWIPALAKERFGGLYKDTDLDMFQYGKLRSFFGELLSKRAGELLKDIVLGFGSDGAIEAAKARYQIEKAAAYERGDEFDISEAEFIDMHLGNLRSAIRELLIMAGFLMLLLSLKPGDDDDEEMSGMRKYAARAVAKYYNEFAFYYNPIEFTNLIKRPFPIISLAEDFFRFFGALGNQLFGISFGDEEDEEDAKPLKYLYRMLPITKEAVQITAIFDDDFRKEWDIRIQ